MRVNGMQSIFSCCGYPGSSLSKEAIEPRQNHDKLAKEIYVFRTGFHLIK